MTLTREDEFAFVSPCALDVNNLHFTRSNVPLVNFFILHFQNKTNGLVQGKLHKNRP